MNEKDVKQAFDSAEKEIKEQKEKAKAKQVAEVKEIVKKTLLEVEKLKEQEDDIKEKLKILKLDIEDLKLGKLERIKERQEKDPLAKKVSVIIIKEKEIIKEREVPSPWYQPYYIEWNTNTYPRHNDIMCNDTLGYTFTDTDLHTTFTTSAVDNQINADIDSVNCNYATSVPKTLAVFKLNNSVVKDNVIGTYKIAKKMIHLR